MEIWKDIVGYEGFYSISTFGRIRNNKCKVLSLNKQNSGYFMIRLNKPGCVKSFLVHRLVAINFILNPENKPQVNHIDGNKLNNHMDNLEWVTRSENMMHLFLSGRGETIREKSKERMKNIGKKYAYHNSKYIKAINVIKYDMDGNFIHKYRSLHEASNDNGLDRKELAKHIKNNPIYKGYIWAAEFLNIQIPEPGEQIKIEL